MILDEIVETKRREVAERKGVRPLAELDKMIAGMAPTRDFAGAIGVEGPSVIAEVKRRSPSRGMLRADFDAVGIARQYERSGAAAISVLTDAPYFGGSDEDLTAVKAAVRLPVLRKEFIIDPYQIHEARAIGADALLLIAAILTDDQLLAYRQRAEALSLAALVEVHDARELERALASGARIVGINNRDLKTFVTDVGVSAALAPLIPKDRISVAESGIRTRDQIEILSRAGIRAFLIGETLIAAQDSGAKLKELLGR